MGLFTLFRKKETDVARYRRELDARRSAAPQQAAAETILLQVEDVFSITGRGTVVVGKCMAPFGIQDAVIVENPDSSRRESVVMGLEKFREKLDSTKPGETVGVLLRGLGKQEVIRGALLRKK